MNSDFKNIKNKPLNLHSPSVAIQRLLPCLNVWYYVLILPFKVTFNTSSGSIKLQTHLLHKSLCFLVHVIGLYLNTQQTVLWQPASGKSIKQDPSQLYSLAGLIAYFTAYWAFSIIVWFKKEKFLAVYDAYYRMCLKFGNISSKGDWLIYFASTVQILSGFVSASYSIHMEIQSGRAPNFRKLYYTFNQHFFGGKSLDTHPTIEYIFSFGAVLLVTVTQIGGTAVIYAVCNLVCLLGYKVGKECHVLIERNKKNTEKVVDCFEAVQDLFATLNDSFSSFMLIFVVQVLIYFCSSLTTILDSNIYASILTMYNFTSCLTYLLLAAEGAQKITSFESFVFENNRQIARQDKHGGSIVIHLLLEISKNPAGAKAHTFLITYGFIVTMLSTVMTYIAILLQFSMASGSKPN